MRTLIKGGGSDFLTKSLHLGDCSVPNDDDSIEIDQELGYIVNRITELTAKSIQLRVFTRYKLNW